MRVSGMKDMGCRYWDAGIQDEGTGMQEFRMQGQWMQGLRCKDVRAGMQGLEKWDAGVRVRNAGVRMQDAGSGTSVPSFLPCGEGRSR